MNLLIEEFADDLDTINDHLTDMTVDEVVGINGVETLVSGIDALLTQFSMRVDFDDVEKMFEDWEDPTEFEAINVLIPLYTLGNEETEYNLSLTYAVGDDDSQSYIIDAEVQYEWESDSEIDSDYIDLDESDSFQD